MRSSLAYRMAGCSLAAIFGLVPVMVPISQSAYAAPASFSCEGTVSPLVAQDIPGGTYSSLVMPPGSLCGIVGNVTVTSGLTVGAGAALAVAFGSLHVQGPVRVGPGAAFGDFNNADPISIDGPLWADHNAGVGIGFENPYGALVSSIAGPVRATNPSYIQIHNTEIGGPVVISGGGGANPVADAGLGAGYNFNDLEDNVIQGPVSETGYDGIWSGVLRNVIGGPLTFSNNSEAPDIDEYDIGSNNIHGPATCNDNVPQPNLGTSPGAPSIVNGPTRGDQAATCTGVAGGGSGPPV